MVANFDPQFGAVLVLSALLMMSAERNQWWGARLRRVKRGRLRWLPWVVLAALAILSSVFGVTHAQEFTAGLG
jgi:uncharacterized membrane protein YfcA